MTAKRKIQILIDILMTVMLLFLMAYQLIGEVYGDCIGVDLFLVSSWKVCFIGWGYAV